MWSPVTQSVNLKGPVPTGLRTGSLDSTALRLTIQVAARFVRMGPKGRLRWKMARVGLERGKLNRGRTCCLRVLDAIEGVLDVLGGELLAVVEGGVVFQVEHPGGRIR